MVKKNSNISLFVLTRSTNVKISPFSRTAAHIFVSPGDAPATITQYVAWMERQFNACQTPRSRPMYLSIFNSFRVIRCLSQCGSPKIAIFTTFWFPLGTPLAVPNVTAYPSTASVPITVLLYNSLLLCSFNV